MTRTVSCRHLENNDEYESDGKKINYFHFAGSAFTEILKNFFQVKYKPVTANMKIAALSVSLFEKYLQLFHLEFFHKSTIM